MPGVDPTHISQSRMSLNVDPIAGGQNPSYANPPSRQNDILSTRGDHVIQQFGQITPPDETDAELKERVSTEEEVKSQEDIAKLNRAQRARNAANKRHSKSKKRKDSPQDGDIQEEEEGEDVANKASNVQREKNRIAAAKCRAKKKATAEEMQDTHREGARRNSFLQREMRELRDQKAFLRNTLLQHDPSLCQCHAIHRFNLAQAQQLAMGVGATIPQPLSPSQGSASSMPTPGSDMSMGMPNATGGQNGNMVRPALQSAQQSSFGGAFGQELHQMNLADSMQIPQFAEFLQGSPDGRGGFAS
jgi:hypothetical protein